MNENSLVTSFFNSSQGPQQREFRKEILQAMQVGVWAPTKRISKEILQAMQVGDRPQQREFRKEILQAMQVGVWGPTQKLTKSQLTINASWG